MHDTPAPQDRYRAAVDSALHVPDAFNGSSSDMAAVMSKALVDVYNDYGGHQCARKWIKSLEEVPQDAGPHQDLFMPHSF